MKFTDNTKQYIYNAISLLQANQEFRRVKGITISGVLHPRDRSDALSEVHVRRRRDLRQHVRARRRHAELSSQKIHRVSDADPFLAVFRVYFLNENTKRILQRVHVRSPC